MEGLRNAAHLVAHARDGQGGLLVRGEAHKAKALGLGLVVTHDLDHITGRAMRAR